MSLTVLLGGARSGKSALAMDLATKWTGTSVALIATAEARDEEMTERIRRHQAERPAGWITIEEPHDVAGAFAQAGDHAFVILDCLSLWVSNRMEAGAEAASIEADAGVAAGIAASRSGPVVCVSNEVGLGIVPINPLAREYRDVLGRVNRVWASAADTAAFVIAGKVLPLSGPEILGGDRNGK
jgi:adenosyl cobinamide kinase/adenosyl cobinamide phosphate guanylyltransferase